MEGVKESGRESDVSGREDNLGLGYFNKSIFPSGAMRLNI